MRFMKWLSVLGLAVVSCGCTLRSLYPFYTPEDVVFDARLLGTWNKIDDSEAKTAAWVVLRGPEKSYRLLSADGGAVVLDGTTLRLGSHLYLDLTPAEELLVDYFIPAHILLQIDFEGDTFKIAMPDQEKLVLSRNSWGPAF